MRTTANHAARSPSQEQQDAAVDAAADAPAADPDSGPPACDEDEDGHDSTECGGDDSDDEDARVHPGEPDEGVDGRDQDCDGTDGVDADGDGVASVASGGRDCDDADSTVHPGAPDGPAPETVDLSSTLASVAVAGDGTVRVAYTARQAGSGEMIVRVATRLGEDDWAIDRIEVDGSQSMWGPLALDDDGNSHLLGTSEADGVRHWTDRSGAWQSVAFDAGEVLGGFGSLAVDPDGAAHSVYEDSNRGVVRATNASGAWQVDMLDELGAFQFGASVAIDTDGTVHAAYDSRYRVRYAVDRAGAWGVEDVPSVDTCALLPSLVLDRAGIASMVFLGCEEDTWILWFGTNASGQWLTDVVPTDGVDNWAKMALDAEGFAHVAYAAPFDTVRYATNRSGEWVTLEIDDGRYPSIAVDDTGAVHVAFQTVTFAIRYARFSPPDGLDQDCSGTGW